jgi:hypothetical protein
MLHNGLGVPNETPVMVAAPPSHKKHVRPPQTWSVSGRGRSTSSSHVDNVVIHSLCLCASEALSPPLSLHHQHAGGLLQAILPDLVRGALSWAVGFAPLLLNVFEDNLLFVDIAQLVAPRVVQLVYLVERRRDKDAS